MDGAENPAQSSRPAPSQPSTQDAQSPPPPVHANQPVGLSNLDLQMLSVRHLMLDLALSNINDSYDASNPTQSSLPASSEPFAPEGPDAPSPPPRVLTEVGTLIVPSPDYLSELQREKLYPGNLKASGYPLEQLSKAELRRKARCQRCSRALNSKAKNRGQSQKDAVNQVQPSTQPTDETGTQPKQERADEIRRMQCKFHSGKVMRGKWTCCNGHIHALPCAEQERHQSRAYAKGELDAYWRLYETPPTKQAPPIRTAVVLDCEMGVAESGDSELIRLSMVDYFTCEVLIDSLVWPDVKMTHYNTRFSGVSKAMMEQARRSGNCILGRKKARLEIWKYVGANTIIVAHGGSGDFNALRLIHRTVVDTQLVETFSDEEDKGLSLKALAKERLGREIQIKGKGHDSLEDAIATRDLLHWHMSLRVERKQLEEDQGSRGGRGLESE